MEINLIACKNKKYEKKKKKNIQRIHLFVNNMPKLNSSIFFVKQSSGQC